MYKLDQFSSKLDQQLDHLGGEFVFAQDPDVVVAVAEPQQLGNDGQGLRVEHPGEGDAPAGHCLSFELLLASQDLQGWNIARTKCFED